MKSIINNNPDKAVYITKHEFFTCMRLHKYGQNKVFCSLCLTIKNVIPDDDVFEDDEFNPGFELESEDFDDENLL